MTKLKTQTIGVAILLFTFGCAKELYQPANITITVDGSDSEWSKDKYRKVQDVSFTYSVGRDQENLYIVVKAGDQEAKRKMMLMGMTIWIDGKGKNIKRQGIQYPQGIVDDLVMQAMVSQLKQTRNGQKQGRQNRSMMDNPEMIKHFERNKENIGLINFSDDTDEAYIYPLSGLRVPIQAKFKVVSEQEMVYELAIPLNLIKKRKKNKISIGIETHTIDIQELMAGQFGGIGRTGGGMRRMRMGGRGRRPMPNQGSSKMQQRRGQFQQMNTPVKEWVKVEIN